MKSFIRKGYLHETKATEYVQLSVVPLGHLLGQEQPHPQHADPLFSSQSVPVSFVLPPCPCTFYQGLEFNLQIFLYSLPFARHGSSLEQMTLSVLRVEI